MGAQCCTNSRMFYTDIQITEEHNIRKFEEETLSAFSSSFSYIRNRSQFNSNLLHKNKTDLFLRKEFSQNMEKLVDNSFYKTKLDNSEFYDYNKIISLIFLLSRPEQQKNERSNYYDKASFILTEINSNEDEQLNNPVERNNFNLSKLLELLFDITLNITDFYLSNKNLNDDSYFKEVKNAFSTENRDKFKEFLLNNLFYKQKGKEELNKVINIHDINKAYSEDTWFLTSGHIRETAFEFSTSKRK